MITGFFFFWILTALPHLLGNRLNHIPTNKIIIMKQWLELVSGSIVWWLLIDIADMFS